MVRSFAARLGCCRGGPPPPPPACPRTHASTPCPAAMNVLCVPCRRERRSPAGGVQPLPPARLASLQRHSPLPCPPLPLQACLVRTCWRRTTRKGRSTRPSPRSAPASGGWVGGKGSAWVRHRARHCLLLAHRRRVPPCSLTAFSAARPDSVLERGILTGLAEWRQGRLQRLACHASEAPASAHVPPWAPSAARVFLAATRF